MAILAAGCAHQAAPKPAEAPAAAAPSVPREKRPVRLKVIDHRSTLKDTATLMAAMRQYLDDAMAQGGIRQSESADVEWHVELAEFGSRTEANAEVACVRFVGRVVRAGQAFLAFDVVSERCNPEQVFSAATKQSAPPTGRGVALLSKLSMVKDHPTLPRGFDDALGELSARLVRMSP